jgi:P27 family predicted phage terminase small subunit
MSPAKASTTPRTALKAVEASSSAPSHLSERSQALWAEIERSFVLEAHERELVRLALEAIDRCEEAREALAREGAYQRNRYGSLTAHPAVAVERDSRIAAVRIFRELGLENAPELAGPLALRRRR